MYPLFQASNSTSQNIAKSSTFDNTTVGFPSFPYTLCLNKVPTFKLSVTLSNLNRFSKFLHCWRAYKFATKAIGHYRLTLGMLLHYLGKLNIQFLQIFSTYERKCKQIPYCLTFIIYPQISIFSGFKTVSFSQY